MIDRRGKDNRPPRGLPPRKTTPGALPSKPHAAPPPPPVDMDKLSRFMSFVLRHHPEVIGLGLDAEGQADINTLVTALHRRPGFDKVTRREVEQIVSGLGASRFEIRGNFIRARYGHTLAQPIHFEAAPPPPELFLGTAPATAKSILADGLKAHGRQRVHLSTDAASARAVGKRRCDDPTVLKVDTAAAAKAGVKFYDGGPAVWLADDVPPQCIRIYKPPRTPPARPV